MGLRKRMLTVSGLWIRSLRMETSAPVIRCGAYSFRDIVT